MRAILRHPLSVGDELPTVSRQFSLNDFVRGAEKTIHTDFAAAKAEGLPGPVAIGPQVAALLFRQLRQAFGRGWVEGGQCALTFRRRVLVDEFCTARGAITRVSPGDEGVFIECDIWIENAEGERVVVGTAAATLPKE